MEVCGKSIPGKENDKGKDLKVINGFTDQTEDSNMHFDMENDDQLKAFQ